MGSLTLEEYKLVRETSDINNFDYIKIGLASPDMIRSWSRGEVKKPETINYRTFKPERDGLFCEKIFGPVKDWRCSCGKYKRIKYRGIICDRCGVEVTQSKVRRERLGHIEMAAPVSHIWYFKGLSNRIGRLLDMSVRDLEKILYFEEYVVVEPGDTSLSAKQFLLEEDYRKYRDEYGDKFVAKMGAEAISDLLKQVNLEELSAELRAQLKNDKVSNYKKKKIVKRLEIVEAFLKSGNRPEWMVMEVIPVIPPDLRPLVLLEGGRFASSDLNDLYRRVINRNNRLKKMIELNAPEVIIRNEKRMLQEAVDVLFDNGRGRTVKGAGNRPLKSLSDMLKGKQGRFRQNLLGKRVDYSGRSVIVVGPELRLHQCGLPKEMALELFKPFILRKLEQQGYHTIRVAKKIVEDGRPEVWDILEDVIQDHPVLLNRAPTLHRQGIQAFQPVLVEGKAIKIHPMVCAAFNADFDGDQMAVHVPLSVESQIESKLLMSSIYNVLSPAHGKPIVSPTQDIVLGCCYMTKEKKGERGEGRIFSDTEEVRVAYDAGEIDLHARIKVRGINEIAERDDWDDEELHNVDEWKDYTTVGRVIINDMLPEELRFVNRELTKKELSNLVAKCYQALGNQATVILLDRLKDIGFEYSTTAGISISIDDMKVPPSKEDIINRARERVAVVQQQYRKGIITDGERYNKVIDTWSSVTDEIGRAMTEDLRDDDNSTYKKSDPERFNSILMISESGAKGRPEQTRQLAGMRGLMTKPSRGASEIIETPIVSNFREGLSVLEYFISTHGSRKGLADTALKTADAGYLTRRLVDVAQDVIMSEEDCGTTSGVSISAIREGGELIEPLRDRILGRVALEDIRDLSTGEVIVKAGEEIEEEDVGRIESSGIEQVRIRSVLTCEAKRGICQRCYGRDLSSGRMVTIGEAVGIIAAQSIGEPGTQLTLRTFHIGGTARLEEASSIDLASPGRIKYHRFRTVKNRRGETVVVSRNSEIRILSDAIQKIKVAREESFDEISIDDKVSADKIADKPTGETIVDRFEVITRDKANRILDANVKEIGVYRELERHRVPYGAIINVDQVKDGEVISAERLSKANPFVRWDPFNLPIITEYSGLVKFEDLIEGVTVHTGYDEITGSTEKIVMGHREEELHPRIAVVDGKGRPILNDREEEVFYSLPGDTHIIKGIEDGTKVHEGDILARIPHERGKTKDITGGLPRVTELFEARKPKGCAIISEINGVVEFAGSSKGMRKIIVKNDEDQREYLVPEVEHEVKKGKGKRTRIRKVLGLKVHEGDEVFAGDPLTEGAINPHDLLRAKGEAATYEYLINEIQEIYRLQGVDINDKHIEVIVRQLMRKVLIEDAGDTSFIEGEYVDRNKFKEENEKVSSMVRVEEPGDGPFKKGELVERSRLMRENNRIKARKERTASFSRTKTATASPVLLGITKASLSTDSFISAASFQETTRVLTEAAIQGRRDELKGLKENVIVGRLIPAGTGMVRHRGIDVIPKEAGEPMGAEISGASGGQDKLQADRGAASSGR
jgi:DNA-directed RNA polymerase subunit beta'